MLTEKMVVCAIFFCLNHQHTTRVVAHIHTHMYVWNALYLIWILLCDDDFLLQHTHTHRHIHTRTPLFWRFYSPHWRPTMKSFVHSILSPFPVHRVFYMPVRLPGLPIYKWIYNPFDHCFMLYLILCFSGATWLFISYTNMCECGC